MKVRILVSMLGLAWVSNTLAVGQNYELGKWYGTPDANFIQADFFEFYDYAISNHKPIAILVGQQACRPCVELQKLLQAYGDFGLSVLLYDDFYNGSVAASREWPRLRSDFNPDQWPAICFFWWKEDGYVVRQVVKSLRNYTAEMLKSQISSFMSEQGYKAWLIGFNPCGGTCTTSQRFSLSDGTAGSLPTPTKPLCVFEGWYTAETGGDLVTSASIIGSNMTLYAHWREVVRTQVGASEEGAVALSLGSEGRVVQGTITPEYIEGEYYEWGVYYYKVEIPKGRGCRFDVSPDLGMSFYEAPEYSLYELPSIGFSEDYDAEVSSVWIEEDDWPEDCPDSVVYYLVLYGALEEPFELHYALSAPPPYEGPISYYVENGNAIIGSRTIVGQYGDWIDYSYGNAIPTDAKGSVNIPEEIDGYQVVGIGPRAFLDCEGISDVKLPVSIQTIDEEAFCRCRSLTAINVPSGVERIGYGAFESTKISAIELPDTIKTIESYCFAYCSELRTVTMPGVNVINGRAFYFCSNLDPACIPSNLIQIGSDCFPENFYDYTTYPGFEMFRGWISRYIGNESDLIVPECCCGIVDDAFQYNSTIEHVWLPESCLSIGNGAFNNCTRLESINIPRNLSYLGFNAFYGCAALGSLDIPVCTDIGGSAFWGCESLSNLTYSGRWELWQLGMYPGSGSCLSALTICDGSEMVCVGACQGFTTLKHLELPETLKSIGADAFYGCSGLEEVVIHAAVTNIGNAAFQDCSSLLNISIQNAQMKVGDGAFRGTKLWNQSGNVVYSTDGMILMGVKDYGEYSTFEVREGTESVLSRACYGITFKGLKLPETLKSIGDNAFGWQNWDDAISGCRDIVIPASVEYVGEGAFKGFQGRIMFSGSAPAYQFDVFTDEWGSGVSPNEVWYHEGQRGWRADGTWSGVETCPLPYETQGRIKLGAPYRFAHKTGVMSSSQNYDGFPYEDYLLLRGHIEWLANSETCVAIPVYGANGKEEVVPVVERGSALQSEIGELSVVDDEDLFNLIVDPILQFKKDWDLNEYDDYLNNDHYVVNEYLFADWDNLISRDFEWDATLWPDDRPQEDRFWILVKLNQKANKLGIATFRVGVEGTDAWSDECRALRKTGGDDIEGVSTQEYFDSMVESQWYQIGTYDQKYTSVKKTVSGSATIAGDIDWDPIALPELEVRNFSHDECYRLAVTLKEAGTLVLMSRDDDELQSGVLTITGNHIVSDQYFDWQTPGCLIVDANDPKYLDKEGFYDYARIEKDSTDARFKTCFARQVRKIKVSQGDVLHLSCDESAGLNLTAMAFYPEQKKSVHVQALHWSAIGSDTYLRGVVTGQDVFCPGDTVTLTAHSGAGEEFVGWKVIRGKLPEGVDLSKKVLQFEVSDDMCGTMEEECQLYVQALWKEPKDILALTLPVGSATVTGSGSFAAGEKATLSIQPIGDMIFDKWLDDTKAGTTREMLATGKRTRVVYALCRDKNAWTLDEYIGCRGALVTTGGDSPWFGEKIDESKREGRMRSGAIGDGQTSWLQVDLSGEARISFDWNVSCEKNRKGSARDFLRFSIDGEEVGRIDGITELSNFVCNAVGTSPHVLRWEYVKDESETDGEDCGWVSNLKIVNKVRISFDGNGGIAPEPIDLYEDQIVELPACGGYAFHRFVGWSDGEKLYAAGSEYGGDAVVLRLTAVWEDKVAATPVIVGPAIFDSESASVSISAEDGSIVHYTLDGSQPTKSSPVYDGAIILYETTTINAFAISDDCYDSAVVSFTAKRGKWTFAEYLDAGSLVFQTSGDAEWVREKDGESYYLRSGAITHNQESAISTAVSGAGTIKCRLRVSSEAEKNDIFDGLSIYVDGECEKTVGGETGWLDVDVKIDGTGDHEIRWVYAKDASDDPDIVGEYDCAWIDTIKWLPTAEEPFPMPIIAGGETAAEAIARTLTPTFGSDSAVVANIRTESDLAAFNGFLVSLGVESGDLLTDAQKTWAYQSFKLSEITTAPQLFEEEPVLKIDDIELSGGNLSLTISLTAGAEEIQLAKDKLAEKIRVGTTLGDITGKPTIVASPAGDGTSLTFTITPPEGNQGFVKVVVE